MKLKPHLKILGVIGDPISHSLSPLMHNAALASMNLPYIYMPFKVSPDELPLFLQSLKTREIWGFNVTIPHKQAVIPFLDSLSREARLIGAVNTVVKKGKKWIGHNTDGAGFIASLKTEGGYEIKNKHVILLGAGGSARAIGAALGMEGAQEVVVINRTTTKAFELVLELGKKFPKTVYNATTLDPLEQRYWKGADLVINATTMGMKGTRLIDFPLNQLSAKACVSDIVYNPLETPLLKKSKKMGLKTHAGWGMLLHQGLLSFELWTGKRAPYKVMKKALLEALAK